MMLKKVSSALAKFIAPIAGTHATKDGEISKDSGQFQRFKPEKKEKKKKSPSTDSPSETLAEPASSESTQNPGLRRELTPEDQENIQPLIEEMRRGSEKAAEENPENPSIARAFVQMLSQVKKNSQSLNKKLGKDRYKKTASKGSSQKKFPKGTIFDEDIG